MSFFLILSLFFLHRFYFVRSGVNVPGLRFVDAIEGLLGIEWIEGKSIRYLLPSGAQEEFEEEDKGVIDQDDTSSHLIEEDPLKEFGISVGTSSGLYIHKYIYLTFAFRCPHGLDRSRTS